MTKTYSEQRQQIYFKAARDLYGVAAQVLDDSALDTELVSEVTHNWVQNQSKITADKARELENLGHEQQIAPLRSVNALRKAKQNHSNAVTEYQTRRIAAERRRQEAGARLGLDSAQTEEYARARSDELSLRPRPGETAAQTIERVVRAAQEKEGIL